MTGKLYQPRPAVLERQVSDLAGLISDRQFHKNNPESHSYSRNQVAIVNSGLNLSLLVTMSKRDYRQLRMPLGRPSQVFSNARSSQNTIMLTYTGPSSEATPPMTGVQIVGVVRSSRSHFIDSVGKK